MKQTLEASFIFDSAWLFPIWDPSLGEDLAVDMDTRSPVKAGDIRSFFRTPLDVITDYTRITPDLNDWVVVHDHVNKFDLAAMNPDKAEKIMALQRDYTRDSLFRFGDVMPLESGASSDVDRYTLLHARTPALPDGRMVQFTLGEIDLFDGPLPFDEIPAVRCVPTEQILSVFGYSNLNDLLSLQDVFDACISAAATNITNCGINNIWVPTNSNIDIERLASGMNVIPADVKPEVLQLNTVSPELFKMLEVIVQRMQTLSGVNAVARGDTGGKDLSGSAMALLQSMAIQFNSGAQAAYTQLIEDTGTQIIRQLQKFAHESRVALVAGKSRGYMVKEFSAAKIEKINRVYVSQGNPYKDTVSGRVEIAKEWLQAGFIKNPDQYTQVLETGRLEPLIEDMQNQEMNIRKENESLVDGEPISALAIDNHPKHIISHQSIIDDPDARKDPQLVMRVLLHIQEHLMLWQMTNPITLQALGIPPLPPAPIQAPYIPGVPLQPPLALSAAGGAPQVMAPPSEDPNVRMPNQPNLPQNPLTGEQWDPDTGGQVSAMNA